MLLIAITLTLDVTNLSSLWLFDSSLVADHLVLLFLLGTTKKNSYLVHWHIEDLNQGRLKTPCDKTTYITFTFWHQALFESFHSPNPS